MKKLKSGFPTSINSVGEFMVLIEAKGMIVHLPGVATMSGTYTWNNKHV